MRKQIKFFAGVLSLAIVAVQSLALYTQAMLPDHYYVAAGETLVINSHLPITPASSHDSMPMEVYSTAGNSYNVNLKLPYGVGIKQVQVQVVDREMVIPGGNPFGIKMFTEGVIVVGMSDIASGGTSQNPAKAAGVKVGDIIISMNGEQVQTNEDVGEIVSSSGGKAVSIELERAGESITCSLNPVKSDDGVYRAGIWVRDSSAGIGTMTYYNPTTNVFAGLGHAICDVDTGNIMPLHSGEIVGVKITGVHRGESGVPGELKGIFLGEKTGELLINSQVGIFGIGTTPPQHTKPIPLALKYEVVEGPATIWCTLDDGETREYAISIEKVSIAENNPTKNMIIRVVDSQLLAKTGGIVQGMSGSPIVQNGKLAGAVTHVFVNDPTRGYGIFAENMDKMSKNVENKRDSLG
ncbi:SpoIVB peptidase [Oscillospiraceae bacterium PP1C4]